MKKLSKSPFALAIGTSLLPLITTTAQAEINPFALAELHSGYMQTAEASKTDAGATDKMKDGVCGEGKCGGNMKKTNPSAQMKAIEGKCATNKPAPTTDSAKKTEGTGYTPAK